MSSATSSTATLAPTNVTRRNSASAEALRLVYATEHDPTDVTAWSGLVVAMLQALKGAGVQTHVIGNLRERHQGLTKLKKAYYQFLRGKIYLRDRYPGVQQAYARELEAALEGRQCDAVFVPGSTLASYLEVDSPIVFWSGSTFAGMVDFYEDFTNLSQETLRWGHEMERASLQRCRLAIYASEWAAESAVEAYGTDPAKVKVIPYGPNVQHTYTEADIERFVSAKSGRHCQLLFVGIDWQRKRGDIALEVARQLNAKGVATTLHIVGCEPLRSVPDFVKVHGWVSKKTAEGRALLDKLYRESHFFIMPTDAEAFGVVFAEASSFGLPSLAKRLGGVTTAVRDGVNGKLFAPESPAEAYADYIADTLASPEAYRALALSTFEQYKTRLNWDVAGSCARHLIEHHCLARTTS